MVELVLTAHYFEVYGDNDVQVESNVLQQGRTV